MKQRKLFGMLLTFWLFGVISIMSQTDVTDVYLNNAGFDEACNHLVGESGSVGTTDPANMSSVAAWSKGSQPGWSAAATFEYGWGGTFNSVSVPASGADGAEGSGEGSLGFTAGWSGSITYAQELSLPAGKYGIAYAVNFVGASEINRNLIGWVPSSGPSALSELTTVPGVNSWVKDTIRFSLSEEASGIIQVGMQASNTSSTGMARMFVDYIHLLKYEGDKTLLQTLTESATEMYNHPEDVPAGSTVYVDLGSAIAEAQTVLDDADASDEHILAAEAALNLAVDKVNVAVLEFVLLGASIDAPASLTHKITNPDFEANGGSTTGWTTSLGIFNGSNAVFDGAPSPNHVLDGDPIATTTGSQTIYGLPKGVYSVKAVARGRAETNGSKMFLGAASGLVFDAAHRVSVEVDRIGDVGGALNFGFNEYETPFVVLQDGESSLTTGVYFVGDCGWSSADNFELYYYGYTEGVLDALMQELQALRDSSDLPVSYELTEIDALLNTVPAEENEVSLLSEVQQAIAALELEIKDNTDADLVDLLVDGKSLNDFSSEVSDYNHNLYVSTPEAPPVPTVTASVRSRYAEEPHISAAVEVPGTTTVTVTAGNGAIRVYTITFASVLQETRENYNAVLTSISNQSLKLSGRGQLTITGSDNPISGSSINLASDDAWVYFPNIKPSGVVASILPSFLIDGVKATNGTNVWVAQYLDGAMVIPHSRNYKALTVYDGSGLSGNSRDFVTDQRSTGSALGSMEDNIESFVLKKGYMATFAENANGTGASRVYIAKDKDVIVNVMPQGLSNSISMVVVRKWRWTTKKGWRGSAGGADRFGAGSHYDYNNSAYSTLDVEYVPMRHNPNWNSYSNFLDKYSSTHALGYNEPDNPVDDGYSSIEDALAAWPMMLESGLRVGSPATTDGGLNWLYSFMDQCDALGYRVDFVAWHFYRANYTPQQLYNSLKDIYNRTGRPLWITEFNNGCNWTYNGNEPSIEQNGQVIESFVQMLDTVSFVERYYVWDGCNESLRMTNSGTGELYPAGIAYRDNKSPMAYTWDYYNSSDLAKIQENGLGFCGVDGVIDTDQVYTGVGYANTFEETGAGIDYKVIFKTEGPKTIYIQYASIENSHARIMVNGSVVADDIEFISTGDLDAYIDLPVLINTGTGIADLRIEATSEVGLPNIDFVEISSAKAVGCDFTADSYPVVLSVSSQEAGNPGERIIDGVASSSSRWLANGFPQSIVIDYGENKSIVGTRVSTFEKRNYQFTVELDDRADFSSPFVVDRSSNTSSSQPISDNFAAVEARYARITVTGAHFYSGSWVSILEFEIVEDTGVSDNSPLYNGNDELILYPNPASEFLNVWVPDGFENGLLLVYNNSGQLVKEAVLDFKYGSMNVVGLAKGVYVVRVVKGTREVSRKLLVE